MPGLGHKHIWAPDNEVLYPSERTSGRVIVTFEKCPKAALTARKSDFRFSPTNGLQQARTDGPFRATTGLTHRRKRWGI
jgi:hypothetical protein